jgi:hypothetical protein
MEPQECEFMRWKLASKQRAHESAVVKAVARRATKQNPQGIRFTGKAFRQARDGPWIVLQRFMLLLEEPRPLTAGTTDSLETARPILGSNKRQRSLVLRIFQLGTSISAA